MKWKQVLWRVGLFACFGLLMEVFYGAALELAWGNWNMHGRSSPWMVLAYGWIGIVVAPMADRLKAAGIPLFGRGVIYMTLIFVVEYIYGVLFAAVGLEIWDYSHLPLNLHGHITLVLVPCWLALGLVLEAVYRRMDACAALLAYWGEQGDRAAKG